jgi:hypothetical protein
LLDEWSVIPLELQPLLADFIRRCLLPVSGLVVKIGAIEQRTRFRLERADGNYLGIELGADVSADVDFDDFMVFDNDADQAKTFFGDLFFRHLSQDPNVAASARRPSDFVAQAFTQGNAFDELVRAAEGVPRDAINIASIAAQRAGDGAISMGDVRIAARKWYQRDKEASLASNEEAVRLLHWIVSEVIGKRRARAFLIRQEIGRSDQLLRALFDGRLVHVIKRGISGGDIAGVRFDAYALDYGCYVDLMLTKAAPAGLFTSEDEDEGELAAPVPADDYRAIRRAILNLDAFRKGR